MESLKELYKIGFGPSSSHTMGPAIAAKRFKEKNKDATSYKVELYGSLALTGKGHLTDEIIRQVLGRDLVEIKFNYNQTYTYHANGMKFKAYVNGVKVDEWLCFSVGGGSLKELDEPRKHTENLYKENNFEEVLNVCKEKGMDNVLLGCYKDNLASAATIKKNGGVLVDENDNYNEGRISQYYSIKL